MTFKVANIIAHFNAESGGPPRTVSQIAAAGKGFWQADLFTTAHLQSAGDHLLVEEFPGHVNLMPSGHRTVIGGLSMMTGVLRHYRAQLLHGIKPNIVHIHGVWSPYLAAFALTAIRHGIPLVIAPHGMLEPWSMGVHAARKSLAMRCYQRKILAGASALHATSKMEADNLHRLAVGNAPIFVIPNAVAEPSPTDDDPAVMADHGKRTLLFLSRVHAKKGLELLLEAWHQARPAGWQLLIVGSGEPRYIDRLKHFCKTRGVPAVEFVPHVDGRLRETVFRRASVFILPTYSENFGNVVAEALIRGLPVITTTGTPWSEVVGRNCGWYVAPTVGEVKRAILEATATDRETLVQMGARGRDYATSQFTLPAIRDGLLTMYRAAMQGTKPGVSAR